MEQTFYFISLFPKQNETSYIIENAHANANYQIMIWAVSRGGQGLPLVGQFSTHHKSYHANEYIGRLPIYRDEVGKG